MSSINNKLKSKIWNEFKRAHKAKKIPSIATCSAYTSSIIKFTRFLSENDFLIDSVDDSYSSLGTLLNFSDKSIAIDFIRQRACDGYSRSTIELDIQAINCWLSNCESKKYRKKKPKCASSTKCELIKLDDVIHPDPTKHILKTYSKEQLNRILEHVSPRNRFSIMICALTGIRVKELFTIQRLDERKESSRNLSGLKELAKPYRFCLLDGLRYTVKGKGGLVREIMVPFEIAKELEKKRLASPMTISDRNIEYKDCKYDLAGGNAISKAFARASTKFLGWSTGIHSLRHDFAKNRLKKAFQFTQDYNLSRAIVSQELGHFREDITDVYLY